ncbi:hypothetical protein ADIARSV_4271 [Arcticibacter svalbardensis MN12-7]|uniref:Uncharacterized protein n=1 Tax=Arcticibacter svalbardensis MN12-7 TaxID=1150600 RepID=R9GUJ2_9SPHI|nr:hypothetical protein [Arcticibacter svalbardensis]EOR92584.1 hypothetical protein ADIARSV_4271 [Arcticibacter svalbardensis MN12-7]
MQSTTLFLLDIAKLTLSGTLLIFIGYLFARPYLDQKLKVQLLDLKKNSQAAILPLRLQAYERIILLMERINPVNLLLRTNTPGLTLIEYQQILTSEIRNEYQHNITQQLYVNQSSWALISKLKEDTIALINNAGKSLPADASHIELSKLVLQHLSTLEINPYDAALVVIRQDIQQLF